jgi:hypothetical protein
MSQKRGCFKYTAFGCLGLIGIVVLFVGGIAIMAAANKGKGEVAVETRTQFEATGSEEIVKGVRETEVPAGTGLVYVHLKQGEFQLKPGRPGEGIRVEAEYHTGMGALEDYYEVRPDSSWVYAVRYHRTVGGLESLFRSIMGEEDESKVTVYLPPDKPIQLRLLLEEGGAETELGGLWITDADIRYNKGGFTLNFDEPLKEPMEALRVRGKMGGFEIAGVGHASPRVLDVDCRMGGGDLDLRGEWVNDADIRLNCRFGGMGVRMPKNVVIEDGPPGADTIKGSAEVPGLPVLRFQTTAKFGEIEAY